MISIEEKDRILLDTSIQIKRVVSHKWKADRLDSIWEDVEPLVCSYGYMEFKNSLIAAIRYLIRVLQEIKDDRKTQDPVKVRLSEVITRLTVDTTIRERQRRNKLAIAYAVQIIEENTAFPRIRPVDEIIEQLETEAENLESRWFFRYFSDGKTYRMKFVNRLNCYLGNEMSPLRVGISGYHCRKAAHSCNIVQHWRIDGVKSLVGFIINGIVKIRDARLKHGAKDMEDAVNTGRLQDGISVGETLCFPIGDVAIVSKAVLEDVGLMTADRDQKNLARHLGINCYFYDLKRNLLTNE